MYEIASPLKGLKHVPFPPAVSKDLVRFDQDCAALSASATIEPAGEDWDKQFKRFLTQAGKPEEPLNITNRLGVRLAFLDTQPDGEGTPRECGRSPHGYTLANIARQLVCTPGPDEHCAAQITTRLAMPIIDFDPKESKHNRTDTVRGGFLGMQSDLAEAIRSEVDDWRNAKEQQHLVLNLSMAWDGNLFGGLDEQQISEMRAGSQAVYRALQYAAGFDVLVLAAAGNQKRAPCENNGPLLPGAWERGEPLQSCNKPLMPEPVVYAVGGVRSDGTPLLNARPGGMPPRAAYGENAVVPSGDSEGHTAMLTGSSVATAVVSSIAAIVWDSRPDLDSRGVMDLLYQSGNELDLKADFWAGLSAPPQAPFPMTHRISLCDALDRACHGRPDCPVQKCPPWEPEPPFVKKGKENPVLGTCQPWLYPQPERPPCAACVTDPPPGG
ncbi:MAG TPA: S8/S53 family peptidase [Thermoanaerobaculia bacterium]|nr:S8/S53 family peptidase [Thermoanaerobaculia bacterium]